jgi:hypothetical protein
MPWSSAVFFKGPGRLQAALHVHAHGPLSKKTPCFTDHLIQRSSIRPLPLRLLLKDHVPSYRIPVSWFFEGIPAGSLSVTPLAV